MHIWLRSLPRSLSALFEIGVLFLPSIPAYLWIWPNLKDTPLLIFQCLVYLYILGGTLWIGLRRWNLQQLGIKRQGMWLGLACGLALVAGRTLVIIGVDWGQPPPAFNLLRLIGEIFFYFGFVALTEELLFRGLVYHLLEEWKGHRWAIWGSAVGFSLWHIFGQGALVGAAMLFYGLIFALMRWRAGGIIGLILGHGLIDILAAQMLPDIDISTIGKPDLSCTICMILGLVMLVLLPIYLWKVHPMLQRRSPA